MSTAWKKAQELFYDVYEPDIDGVISWANTVYEKTFSTYFDGVRELYLRMQNSLYAITDNELEWILVDLPLNMFTASENLNNLRLEFQLMKLKKNEIKSTNSVSMSKEELINAMLPHELLIASYETVIERVQNELSFSRELIMGAKKIWDSRRSSETMLPTAPVVPEDLPEYGTCNNES